MARHFTFLLALAILLNAWPLASQGALCSGGLTAPRKQSCPCCSTSANKTCRCRGIPETSGSASKRGCHCMPVTKGGDSGSAVPSSPVRVYKDLDGSPLAGILLHEGLSCSQANHHVVEKGLFVYSLPLKCLKTTRLLN